MFAWLIVLFFKFPVKMKAIAAFTVLAKHFLDKTIYKRWIVNIIPCTTYSKQGWRKRGGRVGVHPDFGTIEGAAGQRRRSRIITCPPTFSDLAPSLRHPCSKYWWNITSSLGDWSLVQGYILGLISLCLKTCGDISSYWFQMVFQDHNKLKNPWPT